MEDVLIIGGGGNLGKQLIKDFSRKYNVFGTYFGSKENIRNPWMYYLDLKDKNSIKEVFKNINPNLVIISSAKTNVLECESDPKSSLNLNVKGVENILKYCEGKKVVFYSTDNVFDGKKEIYTEEDIPTPINFYGKHKLEAEKLVGNLPGSLIIRTSRHYGLNRSSKYLNKVIFYLQKGEIIKAPIETPGNFSFVNDVSLATLELVEKNKEGIYNVAGRGINSLYDAAKKVALIFGFDDSLVVPVDKDYFNDLVKRPSCPLSLEKLFNEGINMRTLEEGLLEVKNARNR